MMAYDVADRGRCHLRLSYHRLHLTHALGAKDDEMGWFRNDLGFHKAFATLDRAARPGLVAVAPLPKSKRLIATTTTVVPDMERRKQTTLTHYSHASSPKKRLRKSAGVPKNGLC
jgi:hypothetical protein